MLWAKEDVGGGKAFWKTEGLRRDRISGPLLQENVKNQEGVKKGMLWAKTKTREERDVSREMGRQRERESEKNFDIYIYREREKKIYGKHTK